MTGTIAALNLAFLAVAAGVLWWAKVRTRPGPPFPGPRPTGAVFRAWLMVIWAVGFLMPAFTLVVDGILGGKAVVRALLGWYLLFFAVQIGFELLAWKRWRSPVWVIVPCLFLPWRLFQAGLGLWLVDGSTLSVGTFAALVGLWVINVGVHYSNIPNSLRWDHHPPDARFAARTRALPFAQGS
ncbi:MAG: hypothetical protein NZM40_09170 [Sphingomonadaceae bacterium]|uniref:hypothetical protein n=1 Tax=Thermaurantiacus sp. TaxID=2820283 RepID=UPI00298F2EA4|nr:hypothetical protein [Thermaurantiacus sp.]MCS6987578.1 hypothetical protein [Sphingomonadaceae bacterium]MDW8415179.1 hypothetical protein [Thermaurantiacus sp.]